MQISAMFTLYKFFVLRQPTMLAPDKATDAGSQTFVGNYFTDWPKNVGKNYMRLEPADARDLWRHKDGTMRG